MYYILAMIEYDTIIYKVKPFTIYKSIPIPKHINNIFIIYLENRMMDLMLTKNDQYFFFDKQPFKLVQERSIEIYTLEGSCPNNMQ